MKLRLSDFALRARRDDGGWAASARLDAGIAFQVRAAVDRVRATFALQRGGTVPATLRREIDIERTFPRGAAIVWLSDAGKSFALNGLEPISDYTLVVEKVSVRSGGSWQSYDNPAPPITELEPPALGEEALLAIPAPPKAGPQAISYAVPGGPPRLLRLRLRIARVAAAPVQDAVRFSATGSATDQELSQTLPDAAPQAGIVRPAAVGDWRDYHLFVPVSHGALSIKAELGTNFALIEAGASLAETAGLRWMHTIVWNFSISPVAGGWVRKASAGVDPQSVAWWATDWTKVAEPAGQTRTHGLVLAPAAGAASWSFANIFARPTGPQGGPISRDKCYTFRTRLLRATARLRMAAASAARPQFTFASLGVANTAKRTAPVPPGYEFDFVFYLCLPHNIAGTTEEQLRANFDFARIADSAPGEVMLEELRVEELLVGNLPEGQGTAAMQDDWPQVSYPAPKGPPRTVNPQPPACPVAAEPPLAPFLINDHGWALADGKWHLYGIYETDNPIRPMPPGPRSDKTIWNTVGSTSYYVSGLAHAEACDAGELFKPAAGALLNFNRPQPAGNPSQEMMVPGGPGELWNLWAPTIIEYAGDFWMFYSSNWGWDIWLAKSSDPTLSAISWQYVDADGTAPGAARTPVVPASATNQGRDFTVVRSLDASGNQVFHGYWNGGNPIRVFHMQAASPLAFDYTKSTVCFDLISSDTGRPEVDSESCFVVHDAREGLYYLSVSKDGSVPPNYNVGTILTLDYSEKAIVAGCPASGDRSIVLNNANKLSPADPDFVAPMGFCSADIAGNPGTSAALNNGGLEFRANAMVSDMGTGAGGRLLEVAMRTNRRRIFSGPERGAGPAMRLAGRVLRASFPDPNSNVERIAYFWADRGNVDAQDGAILLVDGGDQQKIRSNFAGMFGLWTRQGTGDRRFLVQNLGDPAGIMFDSAPAADGTRYLYISSRNQNQIVRANIAAFPGPGPVAAVPFATGLNNPTDLSEGGDRVYVLESAGAASRIRWFMKSGGGSGAVPDDPSIPYVAPTSIQYNGYYGNAGATLLVADGANGTAARKLLAIDPATGKKAVIASPAFGHGPMGLVTQISWSTMWDDIPLYEKIYWSANPAQFGADGYIASIKHSAAEWVCDTTQPRDPWYFTYTRFLRENRPDGTEWLRMFGWGVQEIEWTPRIASPIGQ